jgi:hypothetical protein
MNPISFKENELPIRELEIIGLASGGQLLLNEDDLKALLSGLRTNLLHLENLETESVKIKAIDAKMSLRRNPDGKTDLMIHPIYRKPATPDFLEDNEAHSLEKGDVASLLKVTADKKGNKKELLVEYDPETREFIVSDTEKIMVPDMVNSEYLTAAQKENYRKGKEVELADKTKFSYSAADRHGIRANKLALVASVLIDGGLSYMLYKGLNATFNKQHGEDAADLSPGYHSALQDLEDERPVVNNEHIRLDGRSRTSR